MIRSRFVPVLAVLTVAVLMSATAHAAPMVGRPTPPLAGPTLNGPPISLASLRGRVVVLNLWATWCAPCREEMPALDAFYRQYAARGVVVVGLSTDKPQAQALAQRIMSNFSYPAIMGATAPVNGFGMPSEVPVTLIIGPDGVVRAIVNGEGGLLTEQRLAALVEPLLPRIGFRS